MSCGLPSFAPWSTHFTRVCFSVSVRLGSLEKEPERGSANHGGMRFNNTASRIDLAQGRADLKSMNDTGATSLGWWQPVHLRKRMGATSRVKVTSPDAADAKEQKSTEVEKSRVI